MTAEKITREQFNKAMRALVNVHDDKPHKDRIEVLWRHAQRWGATRFRKVIADAMDLEHFPLPYDFKQLGQKHYVPTDFVSEQDQIDPKDKKYEMSDETKKKLEELYTK